MPYFVRKPGVGRVRYSCRFTPSGRMVIFDRSTPKEASS
jgi:hypothetical protein